MCRQSRIRQGILVLGVLGALFLGSGPAGVHAEEAAGPAGNDSGIVGGLFHFVGEVVAFPFRIVGEAFDAIF